MVKWPKTSASHADNGGSNPPRVTKCGVDYDEDPPVPIPNTVVKLIRAENTWRAASRENRSMPQQKKDGFSRPFFVAWKSAGKAFFIMFRYGQAQNREQQSVGYAHEAVITALQKEK